MPDAHAPLSPSAAHRWMTCPASIRMTALVTRPVHSESIYAAEGTTAHTVAELCTRRYVLKTLSQKEFNDAYKEATKGWPLEQREDMLTHGKAYAKYLGRLVAAHPHSTLMLEQRLETEIPDCWGTSDAVLLAPGLIDVTDYKYGTGIRVFAKDNEQLMLYGLGALRQYGILGDVETVRIGVFQPRLDHYDTWEISAADLLEWADTVALPAALETHEEDAHFGPSESACRFCPAAGECRARMEAALNEDFTQDPDLLEPNEIADILERMPEILSFCKAVEEAALRKAYSENIPLPGWKVVLSGGRRGISAEDAPTAMDILSGLGYDPDDYQTEAEPKLLGIRALERLMGKQRFHDYLGDLAKPPPGRPSLAREDDPRPAVSALAEAKKEFS